MRLEDHGEREHAGAGDVVDREHHGARERDALLPERRAGVEKQNLKSHSPSIFTM